MAPFLTRPYGDIAIGERYVSRGRTITESDLVQWCALTGDWQVLHTDADYASRSRFGQRIAPGLMILAYAAGFGIPPQSDTIVANYGTDTLRFTEPTFIGDTVHLEAEVVEKVDKRPGVDGVVRLAWNVFNQNGTMVMKSDLLVLMSDARRTA